MTTISGARAPSQSIIVLRAPSRPSTRPPGSPRSASPITSAAATNVVFVAEPVVTSTNQGSASQVIWAPVVETTSAMSRATTERSRRRSLRLMGRRLHRRDRTQDGLPAIVRVRHRDGAGSVGRGEVERRDERVRGADMAEAHGFAAFDDQEEPEAHVVGRREPERADLLEVLTRRQLGVREEHQRGGRARDRARAARHGELKGAAEQGQVPRSRPEPGRGRLGIDVARPGGACLQRIGQRLLEGAVPHPERVERRARRPPLRTGGRSSPRRAPGRPRSRRRSSGVGRAVSGSIRTASVFAGGRPSSTSSSDGHGSPGA